MKRACVLALCLSIVAGAAIAHASSTAEARAQRGRVFAQTNCSQCRAVGPVGESPLRIAPPFRTLHEKYPVEHLQEDLSKGITTGHPTMPEFRLDIAQINDLIAYLKMLEPSRLFVQRPWSRPAPSVSAEEDKLKEQPNSGADWHVLRSPVMHYSSRSASPATLQTA